MPCIHDKVRALNHIERHYAQNDTINFVSYDVLELAQCAIDNGRITLEKIMMTKQALSTRDFVPKHYKISYMQIRAVDKNDTQKNDKLGIYLGFKPNEESKTEIYDFNLGGYGITKED